MRLHACMVRMHECMADGHVNGADAGGAQSCAGRPRGRIGRNEDVLKQGSSKAPQREIWEQQPVGQTKFTDSPASFPDACRAACPSWAREGSKKLKNRWCGLREIKKPVSDEANMTSAHDSLSRTGTECQDGQQFSYSTAQVADVDH